MPFRTELKIKEVEGGEEFELLEALIYEGNTDTFIVPAGFIMDFASIPGWANWLLPKLGKYNKAAVVHDYCYYAKPLVSGGMRRITRREADGVFRKIMRELGVPMWQRYTIWLAVRLAGWVYWYRLLKSDKTCLHLWHK